MKAGRSLAALVGFAGGAAVVVATLALELMARDLPVRGGLSKLQMQSVAVWVLESLPFLLALAAARMASPVLVLPAPAAAPAISPVLPESTLPAPASPPAAPQEAPRSPPPDRQREAPSAPLVSVPPPPLPESLRGASLLGVAGQIPPVDDNRLRALQELVKVLRGNASRAIEESRAKSSYLANMSHELRTPLNAIIGYAEMLLEEVAGQGGAIEEDLSKVNLAARQLVELINNVLDLSKIEVGALSIVLEDVDLPQVVEEVQIAVAPLVTRMANAFTTQVAPGARFVRGDHMRIRQILVNLLGNAFKFTNNGTVNLIIEPTGSGSDSWIAMRVKDNGVGLTRSEIDRVFDEYRQAEARVVDVQGTGLGLAISRKLAELMGGRIDVTSAVGKGSTFSLLLPAGSIREADVAPRSTVALNERLSGLRLLLVDQDPSGLALGRYLEKAGLTVALIADERSAVAALRGKKANIVILDANLDGVWEAVGSLVERDIKVVVLSLRDEDVETALQLGVTAFLTRPVERRLVLATLERCLDDR